MAQLSKSLHQRSICVLVSAAGSPTNAASARASFQRFPLWTRRNWEAAALIGFGIPAGAVATTDDWDKPIVIKQARPSHAQFYEQLFHY